MILAALAPLNAQVAGNANRSYRTPEGRQEMLTNLASASRAEQLQAEAIVKALAIRPGMTVADIGAGAGVMLPALSKAAGPKGKVFAEDLFGEFLDKAREKVRAAGLKNVELVQGTESDPKLPAASCDVAVAVDSYHHFDYPEKMLAAIARGLKTRGRFAIVEYYKRPGAMGPDRDAVEHIRLDKADAIKEIEASGFRLIEAREHVPEKQYIAIFEKR